MGRKNRERIERINKGLELPRSVTHPSTSRYGWHYVKPNKPTVGKMLNHDKQRLARISNPKVVSSSM